MISVIIIAKNEEEVIGDCLRSVCQLAGEIILVDSGSTDKTARIARKNGAIIVKAFSNSLDFSKWRNIGLKNAKGDWIFYLDADERLTPELEKEMRDAIRETQYVAFEIPRRNFYLGQEMHYGGAWPDYVKRLFLKKSLKGWYKELHEDPIFEGEIGKLTQPLIHLTHRDLSAMIEKTKKWSQIEADLLFKAGHPSVTWWRLWRVMLTEFWQRGVKFQGIRDGTVGWIEVIFQMFSRFFTYARLWERQNYEKIRH